MKCGQVRGGAFHVADLALTKLLGDCGIMPEAEGNFRCARDKGYLATVL